MSSHIRSLAVALAVTAVGVCAAYFLSTAGVAAWSQSQTPQRHGVPALPATIDNPPPDLGTTGEYGPVGAVSLVWPGTEVEQGLLGTVERPWIAVAARTGKYRALDAPDLPEAAAGAIAISPEGDRLAWATGDGVRLYDANTDESRELPLEGASRIGTFSPDGAMVSVDAGGLALLDLERGDTVAQDGDADPAVVRRAAWRADSSGVDYVVGDDLVLLPADGSDATSQPSPFEETSRLAWAPTGDRIVALQDDAEGVTGLVVAEADGDGTLGKAEPVDTSGLSVAGLLGFSGDTTVAVSAYLIESGSLERILDVSLDGGTPADLATLPSAGENWRGSAALTASTAALTSGSTDYGAQSWPWSYRARLGGCLLVGVFGLGLWLTRRRRNRRARLRSGTRGP